MNANRVLSRIFVFVLLLACVVGVAAAEDEKKAWTDEAEFSLVATNGNSESTSLGFRNTAVRTWDAALLTIRAAGIRVESQSGDRVAQETAGGGVEVHDPDTAVTAESYALSGRFDRTISERLFWFAGAGWERNEPAGIADRYVAEGGVGNTWFDSDDVTFKTSYGVTYTKQDDVLEDPDVEDTFAGYRLSWNYANQWTPTTSYANILVFDGNLDESSRWRADMENALSVTMNARMALKVGLRFKYENEPALEELTLLDVVGDDTGTTVLEPLDDLDTIFTVSLVVKLD